MGITLAAIGLGWLIMIGAAAILIIGAVFLESGIGAIIGAVILLALLGLNTDLFTIIANDPIVLLVCIAVFLVLGILWSFFRWYRFLKNKRKEGVSIAPLASHHKSQISFWIFSWPLDAIFYVMRDFIGDIFTGLWKYLGNSYQRMSDSVFE